MRSPSSTTLNSLGLMAVGGENPVLTHLEVDSRKVRPGTLFAAMPGSVVHGATFVESALDVVPSRF